ncbi:TPA: hypothetical protein DCG86_09085 [Candidatus Marinimicrobia bacterium]|nr:MAG: hypothetical protein XD77_0042 [Marinimicrobia bacterium 46_47]KUK91604.1 MAG: hypothetical protein XE04_0980 [Marinimicrobia bacterium 46_43]HAE88160.1 hypothetical protein [Candidatus Neomarinimicrobiota bacterium]HBY17548.1 hypothetical protein [Candidatus Neomarinimicrobiota bacterium]
MIRQLQAIIKLILMVTSIALISGCEGNGDAQSENLTGVWISKGDHLSAVQPSVIDSMKLVFYQSGEFKMYTYMKNVSPVFHEGIYVVTRPPGGLYEWLKLVYHDGRVEEGLFKYLPGDDVSMETDLIQTVPDLGHIPPDPERGVGSSSLGPANIQVYVKIKE